MEHDESVNPIPATDANSQSSRASDSQQTSRQGAGQAAPPSLAERPDRPQTKAGTRVYPEAQVTTSHGASPGSQASSTQPNRSYNNPYSNPYMPQPGPTSQQYQNAPHVMQNPDRQVYQQRQQHQPQPPQYYHQQPFQYQYQPQQQVSLPQQAPSQQQRQAQGDKPVHYVHETYQNGYPTNQGHVQRSGAPPMWQQQQQQQQQQTSSGNMSNSTSVKTQVAPVQDIVKTEASGLSAQLTPNTGTAAEAPSERTPVSTALQMPTGPPMGQGQTLSGQASLRPPELSGQAYKTDVPTHSQWPASPWSSLPYDGADWAWNEERTLNDHHRYCYCGEDRNLLDVDVQCQKCLNFFHGRCIKLNMGPVVPFMTNYHFTCKNCGTANQEVFTRLGCTWKSVCATALANLVLMRMRISNQQWGKSEYAAKNRHKWIMHTSWFTRKTDVIPFLEIPRHWAAICTDKERQESSSWASGLANALIHHPDIFVAQDETNRTANAGYTLKNLDLFSFKAAYLNNFKSSAVRKRKADEIEGKSRLASIPVPAQNTNGNQPIAPSKAETTKTLKSETIYTPPERVSQRERSVVKQEDAPAFTAKIPTIKKEPARPVNVATKDLARERKPTVKKAAAVKKNETTPAKLIRRPPPYKPQDFNARPKPPGMTQVEGPFPDGPYYSIADIPYNKRGFKYTPCEAALMMPAIMYRTVEVEPHDARLDWSDMSPYMYLSKDGRSATTDKGFRMGRANVGVRSGDWYWEVKVLRGNGDHGGHVRLGVARREASLDGPIGFDGYSYGIRDKGGEKMHLSRPRAFMESFGTGDVIGFHLSLPTAPVTEVVRDRIPIRYRQQLYFEQFEYTTSKEMEDLLNPGTQMSKSSMPPCLKGSFLKVYKNGKAMGSAFDDLFSFWPPNSQTQRDQPAQDDGQMGYFPAVSVYSGGAVKLNFGPDFECAPETNILKDGVVRCMSERYDEQIAEEVVYDLIDEVDFEEDLKELSLGQQELEIEPIREIAEYD